MGNGGFFLAVYNSSGTNLWAYANGASGDAGTAVAVDGSGNLAFTGQAGAALNFGTGWIRGSGWLVASFTTSGAFNWVQRAAYQSWGYGVAYDSLGHLYVTGLLGCYGATFDFGGISITQQSSGDTFVVQYTK